MAEIVSYEMQVRPGGPGTPIADVAATPGTLALVVGGEMGLVCADPSGRTLRSSMERPVAEAIIDVNPMVSLCKLTHDVTDRDLYRQRVNELWAPFGGGFRESPEAVLEALRERREQAVPMFGDSINFAALDAIDLSGLPLICQRYRQNYFSIFEEHEALIPAYHDSVASGWNMKVIDALMEALRDPASPIHRMEWWWWHALSVTAVPVLEEALA